MNIIIIDFSQIAYSTKYIATIQGTFNKDLWKYILLKTIKKYNTDFDGDEVILAMDGRNSWRKKIFSEYKENRDTKSGEDWKIFFDSYNEFKEEFTNIFPYKVIQLENTEGDDIVAILSHYLNKPENNIFILGGDKDYKQLYQHIPNLTIWDPKNDIQVKNEGVNDFVLEHIIRGDRGDGIPNIFSDDDSIINPTKRQKTISGKMYNTIIEMGLTKLIETSTDEVKKNIERNKKCILLDTIHIPKEIQNNIIESYNKQHSQPNKPNEIFNYFIERKMETLYGYVSEFLIGNDKKTPYSNNYTPEEHDFIREKINEEEIDIFN